MPNYTIYDAKTNLSKLTKYADRGQRVTFGPHGKATYQIVRIQNEPMKKTAFDAMLGSMKGRFGDSDKFFTKELDEEIASEMYGDRPVH